MKIKMCAFICVLVLSMTPFAQQKSSDSSAAAESDSISVVEKSKTSGKKLSKSVSVYKPKTVTNWSKIKDLFK